MERVAVGLIEELDLRNSRPIHPDMLALFVDAKYIELRDRDKLRTACIYVVVGLGGDGRKQILACLTRPRRENLEDWKLVLRGLIERGLRRVMIVIHDEQQLDSNRLYNFLLFDPRTIAMVVGHVAMKELFFVTLPKASPET